MSYDKLYTTLVVSYLMNVYVLKFRVQSMIQMQQPALREPDAQIIESDCRHSTLSSRWCLGVIFIIYIFTVIYILYYILTYNL